MSIINQYDEISSDGKIKYLKEGINLVSSPKYANVAEQDKAILRGMSVVRYSIEGDLEKLGKYNKAQKLKIQEEQRKIAEKQEKTFSLDDFVR